MQIFCENPTIIVNPHFKQYINFYRRNPDCVEFTVYDRYSGKQQTKLLPAYFRSLVWPSASRIISKEDRDVYQSFINNLQKRAAYELPFEGVVSEHSTLLYEDEKHTTTARNSEEHRLHT
jgi:hypothetical protein